MKATLVLITAMGYIQISEPTLMLLSGAALLTLAAVLKRSVRG